MTRIFFINLEFLNGSFEFLKMFHKAYVLLILFAPEVIEKLSNY